MKKKCWRIGYVTHGNTLRGDPVSAIGSSRRGHELPNLGPADVKGLNDIIANEIPIRCIMGKDVRFR